MRSNWLWTLVALAVGLICVRPASAVEERFFGANGRIVLFDGLNFNGRAYASNADIPNLAATGFNDLARSVGVRAGERWQLCDRAHYRGHCAIVDRDIANLTTVGLFRKVSSMRRLTGGGGGGGSGLPYVAPLAGATATFYPTPKWRNGEWVKACQLPVANRRCYEQQSDRFCRDMGLREGAFFQTRNNYLIDVLCLR